VKSNGIACLGEFSDEHIPSERTLSLYASYIAPELVDVERLHKLFLDNYRDFSYEGECRMESDIFALGSCMIEVSLIDFSFTQPSETQAFTDIHWCSARSRACSI
jgi:hypothetical protein